MMRATDPVRIIAGSGRSGTTWVQDVLAEANKLRPVFEPLHPRAVPEARPFAHQYFRPTTEHQAARDFLAQIFAGTFHTWWTDYRVRPDRLRPQLSVFRSPSTFHEYLRRWQKLYRHYRRYGPAMRRERLLVKFIRANLMLGWIDRHFDVRMVLVLRHPGAVVESRLRLGGEDWQPQEQLDVYLRQADLRDDYLLKYNDLLRAQLSAAQAHAAIWCIENQLPLTQLSSRKSAIVCYEHLLSDQSAAWRSVLDTLELQCMPGTGLLTSPSHSAERSRGMTFDIEHGKQWHDRLSPAIRSEIDAILQAMGVTIYQMDDPMPRTSTSPDTFAPPAPERTR